ncbi:uncharacterized protein TM35_000041930 [Trypanosoma theileri]|uniref:Uncharacterized protein n=1 Tax=Trypanosoma theileri TaxID=67003 RepID=A0A1X0P5Z3_9TRYP|nr:uncharacterized protein TM35_000041930 [Trypanosoma theileri]ORC91979.1 hypothetical protein TM35_000041930 [Trypanosoma theileri]
MSVNALLWTALQSVNPWAVLACAIIQEVFAFLWFGCILKNVGDYYLAADKGVRRVEHIVHRYSFLFCNSTTIAAGILRAVSVQVMVTVCGGHTFNDYQQAAVVIALLSCINLHDSFWSQRPLPLLLTNCGYEAAAAVLAAVSYFGMQKYVF